MPRRDNNNNNNAVEPEDCFLPNKQGYKRTLFAFAILTPLLIYFMLALSMHEDKKNYTKLNAIQDYCQEAIDRWEIVASSNNKKTPPPIPAPPCPACPKWEAEEGYCTSTGVAWFILGAVVATLVTVLVMCTCVYDGCMVPHVQQQQRLAIQYMTNDYGSRQMFLWLRMTPHYSISDVCRVLEAIDLTRNLREMKMDEFRTILNHINKVKVQVASDGTVERWLKKEEVKEEVSPIVPGPEKQEK